MAVIYLKPIKTISVEHEYTLSKGVEKIDENAYLAITESDVDTIGQTLDDMTDTTTVFTLTSRFKLGIDDFNQSIIVKSVKLNIGIESINAVSSNVTVTHTITINNNSKNITKTFSNGESETDVLEVIELSEFIDDLNDYINSNGVLPNIEYTLTTSAKSVNAESKGGIDAITYLLDYVHLELEYDENEEPTTIGIHKKENGSWLVAKQAFQKQSGAWVELTEAECKNILQNI